MKNLKEIMSQDVVCATAETKLVEIAKMMVNNDCGEVPIVSNLQDKSVIGVVTDRDIVCRSLGKGLNPMDLTVKDCMTTDVITADIDMTVEDCISVMRENQIRRLPVVDEDNKLCGIISQADLVKYVNEDDVVELIQDVSRPSDSASAIQ
jgi:CBS domain-containing protein